MADQPPPPQDLSPTTMEGRTREDEEDGFPPSIFRSYLSQLLPAVIGASSEDIESSLFSEEKSDEWNDKASKFCNDQAMGVIYVNQVREQHGEGEGELAFPSLLLTRWISKSERYGREERGWA